VTQFIANILITATNIALLAVAFQLIYAVRRAYDFSFSTLYLAAPYIVLWLSRSVDLPFWVSVSVGLALTLALAAIMDVTLYRSLQTKRAPPLVTMLASFGVYLIAQNVIAAIFGSEARTLRAWGLAPPLEIGGARLTNLQAISTFCAICGVALALIYQRFTRAGRLLRAATTNVALATAIGIPIKRIITTGFLVAAALVTLAAILVGLEIDLTPTTGFQALVLAVTACLIGGIDNAIGAVVGAVFVALGQEAGVWIFGAQWSGTTVYALLLLVLFIRRSGLISGPNLRYGT